MSYPASRAERVRARSVRFGRFMDRIDGDWRIPARIERAARLIYTNWTR